MAEAFSFWGGCNILRAVSTAEATPVAPHERPHRVRKLVNMLTVLLLVPVLALWLRASTWGDNFDLTLYGLGGGLTNQPGMMRWSVSTFRTAPIFRLTHNITRWGEVSPLPPELARTGITVGGAMPFVPPGTRFGFSITRHQNYVEIGFPHWAAAIVLASVPALSLLRRVRSGRRRQHGQCISCGYDLRASSERCPECGEPIATLKQFATPAP